MSKKLTQEDVIEMKRLRKEGVLVREIAKRFNVSGYTVSVRTQPEEPIQDCKVESKAHWPEWKLWDNMHKRYGKKVGEQNPHK